MSLLSLDVMLPHHHYPIYIGQDIFNAPALLQKHIAGKQVMIVTNDTLASLYLSRLQSALASWQCDHVVLPDGEQYKTLSQWERIIHALAEHKHHRDATLVTLGGGVIGDLGGFAAACYQRGIPFIQIPTTLLSQVDASIGGKTGVNHAIGKNLIGAFHQPNAVIIDTKLLYTLPKREFTSGLAEIVKAALISDAHFFGWLEQHTDELLALKYEILSQAIYQSCKIKRDIVVQDEKEQNIRALLNLGHTFGHAIERELHYGHWLHGEAIAVGLALAAQLSQHLNFISLHEQQRIINLLIKMQLPTKLPPQLSMKNLMSAMQMDKKIKQNRLPFILLKGIGSAFISRGVTEQDLQQL
ncbi:MAG: 3-dehydroquinate synthase [Coxiella sp. RIFCSPHIGHO2_12_FULL_42_15]|nr:MAG: 3-dehydroquinate synthase [Coxiella sp. RIFCSPHIGHO2_12_FULL_42_15]